MDSFIEFAPFLIAAVVIIVVVRFIKKVITKDTLEDRLGQFEKEIKDLKNK